MVVQLAIGIVLGGANLSDADQLQTHYQGLFGPVVSDSTTRRTLQAMDAEVPTKIAKARARVRQHVWSLLHLQPGGPVTEVCHIVVPPRCATSASRPSRIRCRPNSKWSRAEPQVSSARVARTG